MFLINKLRNQNLGELQDMLGGRASWADPTQRRTLGRRQTDIRQVSDKPSRGGRQWEDFAIRFLGGPAAAEMLAARRAAGQSDPSEPGPGHPGMAAIGGEAGRGLEGAAPAEVGQLRPMPLAVAKMLDSQSEIMPRHQWGPPTGIRSVTTQPRQSREREDAERLRRELSPIDRYAPPGPGKLGDSYLDPIYDQIEGSLEQEYGLPLGLLTAIRTRGERSHAYRVSPRYHAQSVYQITPPIRRALRDRQKGADAYRGLKDAARAAAMLLDESYDRTGDWNLSIAEYHGGTNRRNWGRYNREYRRRVGDFTAGKGEPIPTN